MGLRVRLRNLRVETRGLQRVAKNGSNAWKELQGIRAGIVFRYLFSRPKWPTDEARQRIFSPAQRYRLSKRAKMLTIY